MADELKKIPELEVRLEDGANGEFKVLVAGRTVAEKADSLPSTEQVIDAVKAAA